MFVSRASTLLSAVLAAAVFAVGPVLAAEEVPSAATARAEEARKPDVVLNQGSSATSEAEPGNADKTDAKAPADGAAIAEAGAKPEDSEPVVENEGNGVKSLSREGAAKSEDQSGENAAEEAAMKEAEKITKAEQEKPAAKVKAEPTLFINIDLAKQRMTVSEGKSVKYTWRVSSGRYGYPTPTGTFSPVWMTKMWYSRQYDNAPMPHSIFFSGGAAIHATSYTNQLGSPASHGCVRLSPRNAETLYKLVSEHGKARTQIVVHGTPEYQVAERRDRSRYDRYSDRYYYGEPARYWREVPEWSYKRRYSTYYGTPPRYRMGRDYYRGYGYRSRGMFSDGYGYGYGY